MPDAKTQDPKGLPGSHVGPAQPLPDDKGAAPEENTVPRPDLGEDADGDVRPEERQKLPLSSEDGFGEPAAE